jgi:hypothetical protein
LVLSLSAAWIQFTTEPDKVGDNEILVMANQPSYIEQIDWVSDKQEVHVEQRNDELGRYLWVEYIDNKVPEEPSIKYFIAGDNGTKLLDSLSPLVAIRKLDLNVDGASLGLSKPSATLSVKSNGNTRLFSIGDEAYGTKDLYVRDEASQEIFLIDDSKLRNLRQARTTLPNRAVFPKSPKEATSASLNWQDKTVLLTHQNVQDAKKAKWIYTEKPEADATQVETWLSKALRTSVSRSTNPNEDLTTLEPQFTISLTWENGSTSTTTYAVLPEDNSWWTHNKFTRGYVRVSGKTLTSLLEDIPSLFEE